MIQSLQFEQLHVKNESSIGWDDSRMTTFTIGIVRGAGEDSPFTHTHLGREGGREERGRGGGSSLCVNVI